jgi:hypothetical protein
MHHDTVEIKMFYVQNGGWVCKSDKQSVMESVPFSIVQHGNWALSRKERKMYAY